MKRYKAQDLLQLSVDELWALPEERHIVVFEDGEVVTHTRATITSVYLWYPLKHIPSPLLKDFHIGDTRFTNKVLLRYINRVLWSIYDHRTHDIDTEVLAKLAIETINVLYNDFTIRLSGFVTTLSAFDILEVMDHPGIKEALEKVEPTEYSIEDVCYKKIGEVFASPTELRGNPIAEAVKSGTLNTGQIYQSVGSRGYVTDIDSSIFPEPILRGYIQGINDLYGAMIESRTGTKSLAYNKELLRDTEYFNRKTQLVAQYVQRLHYTDCGTPHTIEFPVMKSLLKQLKGKYYVHPETGKLEVLQGNETHLIGTKIRLRSVLGCIHPDSSGICQVCYGELSLNIPRDTNIGQVSAVSVGDKITSSVLSTKHLDSTSKVEKFIIEGTEAKYLMYRKEPETLYLKKQLKGKHIKLTVFKNEVESLADVLMVNSLTDYPESNASQLTQIYISTEDEKGVIESDILRTSLYNRKASFSKELLEHIQSKRWTYDDQGNVVIDLAGFNYDLPFLTLPYKHVNMYEVMMKIQTFLHSGTDTGARRLGDNKAKRIRRSFLKTYKDPVDGLIAFAEMLNEKLSINVVHCEVLVYSLMVRASYPVRDYRLPKPGIHGVFEKYNTLMLDRSLAGAMAYEKQDKVLISARSFVNTSRPDHPYDFVVKGGRM